MPWDAQGEAQTALRTIVADPRYGPAALSNPQTMTNLLKDMLPDTPREASVLVAASEAGVPGWLQSNVSQGMDWDTASRLAVGSFEHRTALTPEACTWAVSVLGSALHLDAAAARPQPVKVQDAVQSGNDQQTTTAPALRAVPAVTPEPGVSPGPPKRLRIGTAAAAAAGAILIIWACALPGAGLGFYGDGTSLFSFGSWHAIPSVVVAVLGAAAAVLFLAAHNERQRGLAAGMLLAFGMAVILAWIGDELLTSPQGLAQIVGMVGGLLLLVAGVLAVAGRKGQPVVAASA